MAINGERNLIEQIVRRKANHEKITMRMILDEIIKNNCDQDTVWRGLIKKGFMPALPEELKEEDYLAGLYTN